MASVVTRLAQLVLAARNRRRRDFAKCDAYEWALLREMAKGKSLSFSAYGVTFRAVPAKVHGSPSQRKRWRENMPDGALPQWLMPRVLELTYPRTGRS